MKSTRKVVRFDYSKFGSIGEWDWEILSNHKFWGFHPKKGRLRIDTKRYKKVCETLYFTNFLPSGLFRQRNTVYYEPTKRRRHEYKVNIFRDLLENLKNDWLTEYKQLLNKITTPEEVEEKYRLNTMCFTLDSDDYEDICIDAKMAGCKRLIKYRKVIKSLYCQFIQKISSEVDRYTLIFMTECGWKGANFSLKSFIEFSYGLLKQKNQIKINALSNYDDYNLLHKLNNFLKHNSIKSYSELEKFYPKNVLSIKNGSSNTPYENGMFASDWIIIEPNYIDDLLKKLIIFFEDYCRVYLKEDIECSHWDYDDYFYHAKQEIQDSLYYVF